MLAFVAIACREATGVEVQVVVVIVVVVVVSLCECLLRVRCVVVVVVVVELCVCEGGRFCMSLAIASGLPTYAPSRFQVFLHSASFCASR